MIRLKPSVQCTAVSCVFIVFGVGCKTNQSIQTEKSNLLENHPDRLPINFLNQENTSLRTNSTDASNTTEAQITFDFLINAVVYKPNLTQETQRVQLVAGDWLAWQCAYAGNYFEKIVPLQDNAENPARFANVITDD